MSDETETPRPDDQGEDHGQTEAQDAQTDAADAGAPEPAAGSATESATGADAAFDDDPEALRREIANMRDQLLRIAADAENTRKRAEREVADARVYAVTNFAGDLLSVDDNLARALGALTPELRDGMREAGRTLLDGIEMTQKSLHAALARHSVEPIAADPGQAFDPNVHQAVAQIPSPHPQGAIVEVMQGGWKIGDRVLRAAMVAVSSGAPATSTDEQNAADDAAPEPGSSVDTKV